MKKRLLFSLTIFLILLQVASVTANGGYFPEPDYWVRPGDQRAIIFYEDGVETMILSSGFQGNAENLAWIIPVPWVPEVTKANEDVFQNIAELTRPVYDDSDYFYGKIGRVQESSSSVYVVETKKVDYYNVSTVAAGNSEDLVTWFNENNYDYPEEYSYVLNSYIERGWFFIAIRISEDALESAEVADDIISGHTTPIKIQVKTDKMFFPLKISSVEFEPDETYEEEYYWDYGAVDIQLWVISADGKYDTTKTNFYTNYGNWFEKSQIQRLGYDESGNSFFEPTQEKYFITSLSAYMSKDQMDDDVYFVKSADDNKVGTGPEPGTKFLRTLGSILLSLVIFILSPLGWLIIAGALLCFLTSSKAAKIIGIVLEVLSIATISLLYILSFVYPFSYDLYMLNTLSFTIAYVIILIAVITLLVIEIKKLKK